MTKTDRAFRALAQAEAQTVIALMSVAGLSVRGTPVRADRLPTRLDPLPPSQDVDLLLRTGRHTLRRALLELMASRALRTTSLQRRRVEACDDLAELTAWFDRALLAERARDVFGTPTA